MEDSVRAGWLCGCWLLGMSVASAQTPYWTNGVELATPPLTGIERIPTDTYALSGQQQEGVQIEQIQGYLLGTPGVWSSPQTYSSGDLLLLGSSTGRHSFVSNNATASNFALTLPNSSGTIAELNFGQSWTAAQSDGAGGSGLLPIYDGGGGLKVGVGLHLVVVNQTLTAGAATITLTGGSVFGNTPICVGSDQTGANAVQVVATSTSSVTLAGTGTDVVGVICAGN